MSSLILIAYYCSAGICVPGYKPASQSCTDGNLCTQGDYCSGTSSDCISGAQIDCSGNTPGQCENGFLMSGHQHLLVKRITVLVGPVFQMATRPQRSLAVTQTLVQLTTIAVDQITLALVLLLIALDTLQGSAKQVILLKKISLTSLAYFCSAGSCIPGYQSVITACSDGDPCTVGDHCSGTSACTSGSQIDCSGHTPGQCENGSNALAFLTLMARAYHCVSGTCVPNGYRPSYDSCDDGIACTINDHCSGSDNSCSGTVVDCSGYTPSQCETGQTTNLL